MNIRQACSPREVATMDTAALRNEFLVQNLFSKNEITLTYSHYDRMIVGGAFPLDKTLALEAPAELRADFFLERREIGIINVGGPGSISAGAENYKLDKLDCVYLGKGTQ